MSNRLTFTIAIFLLLFVFFITFFSIFDDSFTTDEPAHIVAGFSYLTQKDMRLNPEHPPLIKDLAALCLLRLNLNFPKDHPAWTQEDGPFWWHQFNLGGEFLYKSGNNPDQILFWSRIPMIFILILLGFYIFKFAKELFGNKAALLSLFLFSFSPTFLAHGRLVTTDVGATAGIFIGTYYFLKALKSPTLKNTFLAGVSFGIALLCKFTTVFLFPLFVISGVLFVMVKKASWKKVLKTLTLTFIIGLFIVLIVYQYHVLNYPPERQVRDIEFLLSSHPFQFLVPILIKMAKIPPLRALSQYLLGVMLVFQRGIGGNTTYFLGEISAAGWKNYFPIVYIIKTPLTFHILTVISLLYLAFCIKKPLWQNALQRLKNWIKEHFEEFTMITFLFIYWSVSLTSSLNIGVRHLLPVFPFTMILVSGAISDLLKEPFLKLKYLILFFLCFWQAFSVISIYPHFLAYANEIVGGPDNLYLYTVDSNLDWGQDLKRLKKWVDLKGIEKIYVDYFGGGNAKFYLKEKFAPWWGTRDPNELPKGSYLAVSATFLQGGRGEPVPGFDQPSGYYNWLNEYTPIAKIGYSIFVYYIE